MTWQVVRGCGSACQGFEHNLSTRICETVSMRHNSTYSTAYNHASSFETRNSYVSPPSFFFAIA